ncbi:MAG TPA: ABC transporter substrate-binding protein [Longimicrobiaceae bacterium]|nr:ABC transporter substrate-binding protein [Longimicrobiaceae bacterium]
MRSRLRPAAPWVALALTLLTGCDRGGGDPIQLGFAAPINQGNGVSARKGVEMAVEEINRDRIDGRTLELVIRDDEGSPEKALDIAEFFRDSVDVVAVVGHITSSATLEAAKVYNDESGGYLKPPVPQISPSSSSPLVTHAGPYTFRVCPSDLLHGPKVASLAYSRLGSRRAAVLYTNDAYGRGVAESFASAFQRSGGSLVARDPYLPATVEGPGSVTPYLVRAIRSGMDALMIAGQGDTGIRIVREARRLGYTGPILGADALTGVKDTGADAEGIYISSAFLPDRSSEKARAFVEAYMRRFNELPDHRGAMAYDAVMLLAQAIREVGTDRKAIRDYLAKVGREGSGVAVFEGVSGTIAFDENGDVPGKEVAVGVVRGGRLVSVSQ